MTSKAKQSFASPSQEPDTHQWQEHRPGIAACGTVNCRDYSVDGTPWSCVRSLLEHKRPSPSPCPMARSSPFLSPPGSPHVNAPSGPDQRDQHGQGPQTGSPDPSPTTGHRGRELSHQKLQALRHRTQLPTHLAWAEHSPCARLALRGTELACGGTLEKSVERLRQ